MEELELVNGVKYDHPKKTRFGKPGSKDVSDAVAGSVWSAINYELDGDPVHDPKLVVHRNMTMVRMNYGERGPYG
jgi:hypothetical protein